MKHIELHKEAYAKWRKPWAPGFALLPSGSLVDIATLAATEDHILLHEIFKAVGSYTPAVFDLRDCYVEAATAALEVIQNARKS